MKGSNSRFSHRCEQRYSNMAHIQGGMVTDADLTEAGQLHQERDEVQNSMTVGSGVPAHNGVVLFEEGLPRLQQGLVLAQGKQGRLVAGNGDADLNGVSLFANQADLPQGPELPDGKVLLYADLWERPVFALQDDYLTDPGLHGAETSFRTRTMVQVKALPLTNTMTLGQSLIDLEQGNTFFCRTGDALASVTPKDTEIAMDDCDPCAEKIEIVATVPNALFRVEIVEIKRDAAGDATHARFAWSMENGAAIESMSRLKDADAGPSIKEAFARDDAVYEYFSEITEAQIGAFAPGFTPQVPEFSDTLNQNNFTHIRRWDGCAEVNINNLSITDNSSLGRGKMTISEGKALLTLDGFAVEIIFADRALLVGDHWLIELRRFAKEAERLRLVGSTNNMDALPIGVEHHFCALFVMENGEGVAPTDEDRRRLSFPALANIPASHISFEPDCKPLFGEAKNVAEALNTLCDLDASHVSFDPPDSNCDLLQNADTVDEALKRLCSVQDDSMLTRVLRLMMDWGVVCGIRPRIVGTNSSKIAWSAGTMLDRTGRLIDVEAGETDLGQSNVASHSLKDIMHKEGRVCLSFAANSRGELDFILSDHDTAFGTSDRTFDQSVKACVDERKRVDFGKIRRTLTPGEAGTVKKMVDVWANRKALYGNVPLTEDESRVTSAVNRTLAKEYLEKAEPERKKEIEGLLKLAENHLNPNDVQGVSRDKRRMMQEAAMFGILANAEAEDDLSCRCQHGLTPCPSNGGQNQRLVPVAGIKLDLRQTANSEFAISELCVYECRKQAMTWRSFRYYNGSFLNEIFPTLKNNCCKPRSKPDENIFPWLDKWTDHLFKPNPAIPFPKPKPEPDPLWPPILLPDEVLPMDPGFVDPLPYATGKYLKRKPVIDNLNPNDATNLLTGNGFIVEGTLDLFTDNPLEDLKKIGVNEKTVLGREVPEPGDKVVMMSQKGRIVDFVVIEKGQGKLPFENEGETAERVKKIISELDLTKAVSEKVRNVTVEIPTKEINVLEGKLQDLDKQRSEVEKQLGTLTDLRQKMADEIAGFETKLMEYATRNTEMAAAIEKSRKELAEVEEKKVSSLKDIKAAKKELEGVKNDHAIFLKTMREAQSIEAVLKSNPEAVSALKDIGIFTLKDINKTQTKKLTETLRQANLKGSDLKRMVTNFINRR